MDALTRLQDRTWPAEVPPASPSGSTPTRRSTTASRSASSAARAGPMSPSKRNPEPRRLHPHLRRRQAGGGDARRRGRHQRAANRCAHRGVEFCRRAAAMPALHVPLSPVDLRLDRQADRRAVSPRLQGQGGMPADFRLEEHGAHPLGRGARRRDFRELRLAGRRWRSISGRRWSGISTASSTAASSNCWATCASASAQLETDVREHQGPLSRQPASRVPRHLRPVPARPALGGRDGRERPPRRAAQPQGEQGSTKPRAK